MGSLLFDCYSRGANSWKEKLQIVVRQDLNVISHIHLKNVRLKFNTNRCVDILQLFVLSQILFKFNPSRVRRSQ